MLLTYLLYLLYFTYLHTNNERAAGALAHKTRLLEAAGWGLQAAGWVLQAAAGCIIMLTLLYFTLLTYILITDLQCAPCP